MLIVTLRIKVPRDQRNIILDAARRIVGPTEVQPGCVSCRFYQDIDDSDAVFLVEEWKTRKDFDRRLNSQEYRIILSLVDMSEIPPEFKLSKISKTEGLEALEVVKEKH
jgi:quinol monooxygenase YgiN